MKSQQNRMCTSFVVALLSIIQLSSTLPTHSKDSTDETNCHPLLATELDSKIISDPVVRSAITMDESQVYLLRSPLRPDEWNNLLEKIFKGGRTCEGVENGIWMGAGFQVIVGMDKRSWKVQKTLLSGPPLLIAPATYTRSEGTLLKITCEQSVECLNISFTDPSRVSPKRLSPRAAVDHIISGASSHDSVEEVRVETIVGGVIMTVIGLLVLISVAALCGGSNTYEPTTNSATFNSSENQVEAVASTEVKANQAEVTPKLNGSVSQSQQPSTTSEPADPKRQSLSPPPDPAPPAPNPSTKQERARTLSARSFDPLPEIPKLDLAEELPTKDDEDEEDKDNEDPYSYARVPKADEVPHSDSSDEDDTNSPDGASSTSKLVAPYGKVISSDNPTQRSLGDGEYAEVISEGGRGRSVTAPIDPSEVGILRDTRAFTESAAHLPLPAIPKGRPQVEEDNEMYDSIPETMNGKVAKPAKVNKERLYESVDEMAEETEDMYESVPEELKPDSPLILTPSSPEQPPLLPTTPPRPPDSPIPNHHSLGSEPKPEEPHGKSKKGDKKALEKTFSASDQPDKQKRSFSIFGRKKATSVSAGVGKTRKKSEKDGQSSKPHQREPLPDIPHQGLPSPNLASPKLPFPRTLRNTEEEKDTYDKPQLPLPLNKTHLGSDSDASKVYTTEEAKARAKTLPAGLRSPGFKSRQDLPLPEVPEHSGQGLVTVTHKRLLEPGSERTKPYDIVHISPPRQLEEENEPNYDTVRPEVVINPSLEVRSDPDPGYDRVGIKLEGGEENPVLSDEDKSPEESSSPVADMEVKVTALSGVSSLEDSIVEGPVPEHDEIGYARVPEMYLMRKRAMSASQGVGQNVQGPDSQKAFADDSDVQQVGSPDEMYAIIDKAAKKKARQKKDEEGSLSHTERETSGTSPIPPPLPPVGDLGDLSEFEQPPLPEWSEDADRLMVVAENDSGYSRVLKVGQSENSDPPYAKVKSKVEHPYAELNIGGIEKNDLKSGGEPSDASPSPTSPIINSISSGVATIDTKPTTPAATNANPDDDESHMYDTLGPISSPCEVTVQINSPEEENVPQNTYDTLEQVVQSGNTEDEEKEGPYEEIDESTRQNLQKLHQTHSKPA